MFKRTSNNAVQKSSKGFDETARRRLEKEMGLDKEMNLEEDGIEEGAVEESVDDSQIAQASKGEANESNAIEDDDAEAVDKAATEGGARDLLNQLKENLKTVLNNQNPDPAPSDDSASTNDAKTLSKEAGTTAESEPSTSPENEEPQASVSSATGITLPDILKKVRLPLLGADKGVTLAARQKSDNSLELGRLIHKEVMAGGVAVGAFVLFFVGWSAIAPLSSAAIAPGFVSPEGSRRTVQHLEGGIIERILVEDGTKVRAGAPVVLLEDTMARASFQLLRTQYFTLAARQSRLSAVQLGNNEIAYPTWLTQEAQDPDTFAILKSQAQVLQTQLRAHGDRKAVLRQRGAQLREEIKGLEAQVDGQTRQLELIGKEIQGVQQLVDKGLERLPRLLALQRTEADIRATQGANTAMIARAEQAIGEADLQLIAADTNLQDEVAQELSLVQTELATVGERMAASEDVLDRIQILAPVSGSVVNLRFHTEGGIIGPGQPILDIVPDEERLLIEARVSPMDIDIVYDGLEAQVHLSAFAQRNSPRISGRVHHVSADRIQDPITGEPYYKATILIDDSELAKLGAGNHLTPGMPAEVMIVTGQKTLMGYLFSPIADTFRRSFREG